MKYFILCIGNVLLMVTGQMIFKYGLQGRTVESFPEIIKVMFSPIIILGLAIYAITAMLWLYILSRVPISFAYPIQALAFPLVLVLSMWFFGESISLTRWIGIAVIMIGVFFVTR